MYDGYQLLDYITKECIHMKMSFSVPVDSRFFRQWQSKSHLFRLYTISTKFGKKNFIIRSRRDIWNKNSILRYFWLNNYFSFFKD